MHILHISKKINLIILGVIFAISVSSMIWIIESNRAQNGSHSFPFDDAWIHLQFAKNISTYGCFSYFKDEMITAGSTAPLYTLLIGALWNLSSDKYLLGYAVGIICYCIAGWFLYKISTHLFSNDSILALGVVSLFMLEPHIQYIALSGMETTLFISLLMIVWYFYLIKRPIGLGIAGGLLLWCRPEGIIFLAVLLVDLWYHSYFLIKGGKRKKNKVLKETISWISKPSLIIIVFAAGYITFNMLLSGTILPNSFAAKGKYYESMTSMFIRWSGDFFSDASNPLMIVCYLAGFIVTILAFLKKQQLNIFPAILWSILLFLSYWYYLPRVYQTGRYLMPILPFVLLIGVQGIKSIAALLYNIHYLKKVPRLGTVLTLLLIASGLTSEVISIPRYRNNFIEYCRGTSLRQVKTALWIRDTLPNDAIIATHDIGVLAYYSERKIFDMVGLVTPSMIRYFGNFDSMMVSLRSANVSYIATSKYWFDIDNKNPVFQTNILFPEVMEVFHVDTSRFIFIPLTSSILNSRMLSLMKSGDYKNSQSLAEETIKKGNSSSQAFALLSTVSSTLGDYTKAELSLNKAKAFNPDGYLVHFADGVLAFNRKEYDDAIRDMNKVIQINPYFPLSYLYLSVIYEAGKPDNRQSSFYKSKYDSLMAAAQ